VSDVVRRHLDAFNAGDADAVLAGLHYDAVWVTGQNTVCGRAELRGFLASALEGLRPTLQLRELVDGGDVVAAELVERWTYEGVERMAGIAAFYRVRKGRITRVTIYREGSADPAAG